VGDGHAERLEDVRVCVGREGRAGRPFDDEREQRVARVRVEMPVAGHRVERLLAGDNPQDRLVVEGVLVAPPGKCHQRVDIPQAARVMDQVPDGDRPPVVRQLRHVCPHVVVGSELALPDREGGRHRGELLRDRADVEHRVGRDRHALLEVGHPVSALVGDLPVLVEGHGAAW
jgi:hypothetical protein